MSEEIKFKDLDELNEYVAKQIQMGNFDYEVEDRFDYLNVYNDFYFPDESSFMQVVEYDILHGEHDKWVAQRAAQLEDVLEFMLPASVHIERQAVHKSEHPDGVMHWTFCARCLERYK